MLPFGLELPLLRQVWRLALPVIFTNLLMASVNIADVFMVGRLGPIEIAAVGIANTVRLLVLVAILSVSAGAMALAAQAKGARDPKRLSFVVRQSLSLLTLAGLVFSVFGWLGAEPILRFLNSDGDPQAVVLGTGYLKLLFLGTVFLAGNFAVGNLMQGAGDTVTPLQLSIGVNVLNILFNYLLIFGPGPLPALGVEGAALGTIAARALGMAAGVALFYSGRNVITLLPGSYLPHWGMFRDILAIGIPSGLQGLVRNSTGLLLVRIVTSTAAGSYGAAALAIGLQIESLAFMPGLAVNIAATSLVGQSLGAWQVTEARKRGRHRHLAGGGGHDRSGGAADTLRTAAGGAIRPERPGDGAGGRHFVSAHRLAEPAAAGRGDSRQRCPARRRRHHPRPHRQPAGALGHGRARGLPAGAPPGAGRGRGVVGHRGRHRRVGPVRAAALAPRQLGAGSSDQDRPLPPAPYSGLRIE